MGPDQGGFSRAFQRDRGHRLEGASGVCKQNGTTVASAGCWHKAHGTTIMAQLPDDVAGAPVVDMAQLGPLIGE